MGELILQLLPELAGMAITPAAIAGCVLLLQTKRALANAFAFFVAFMIAYTAIGVAALLGGATHDTRSSAASHWAGLAVGLIFVAFGVGNWSASGRRRTPARSGCSNSRTPNPAGLSSWAPRCRS
ncbi:GAP family protein [Prescottella defluvii]|nr:GAP family protein [Prescottella defluvii]